MLEATLKRDNAFIGLSYNAENLPQCINSNPASKNLTSTLVPKDAQDWLKRLRARIAPIKVRFYLVGEYGNETFRPHYHAAVFGLATCDFGKTREYRGRPIAARCCPKCQLVHSTWGKGDVSLGVVEPKSAQYLAGYVTKKLTNIDDPRLEGRWPEFARMSNRPGIGQPFLWDVASALLDADDGAQADVPVSLAHGGKNMPLGRYMRNQLRKMIGKEQNLPEELVREKAEKMLAVLNAAKGTDKSLRQLVIEAFAQDVRNIKAKAKIYSKRGNL